MSLGASIETGHRLSGLLCVGLVAEDVRSKFSVLGCQACCLLPGCPCHQGLQGALNQNKFILLEVALATCYIKKIT